MWPVRQKSSSIGGEGESIASAPKDLFELGQQLEKQHEIKANIAKVKKEIIQKQSDGLKLALNVSRKKAELGKHIEGMDEKVVNK